MAEIVPGLVKAKQQGKLRHIAVSETGPRDPEHTMLARAAESGVFEVFMLGFSMMHQNAKTHLLPRTREKGIGTLCMFAVRNIFSKPDVLKKTFGELAAEGKVPAALAKEANPLGFLVHEGGAESVTDAAYRFARHQPGIDVVLFGTGNVAHLQGQHRLDPAPAAAGRRYQEAARPLRPPHRRRPRPARPHPGGGEEVGRVIPGLVPGIHPSDCSEAS